MIEKFPDQAARAEFLQQLRKALIALYDPLVLGKSPLAEYIRTIQQVDDAGTLRQTLIDAIEALKPARNTPGGTKSIRVYEILRHRFIEQQIQRTVAETMNLSIRQLQREEKTAIEILGDALWRTYHLEQKAHQFTSFSEAATSGAVNQPFENPSLENGMEWEKLVSSIPYQKTNIIEVVQEAIDTMKSSLDAAHITVSYRRDIPHHDLYMQTPLLRQGLLNIISTAIELVPQGKINFQTTSRPGEARVSLKAWFADSEYPVKVSADAYSQENLEIARKLINLCKGVLKTSYLAQDEDPTITGAPVMLAEIDLTAAEQIMVLVVEDHADTLQLYQRYLAESRYQLITARDIHQGLSLAEENGPKIIILDVMMPESDGWALLSQLRVHPRTQHIPVIVCSIIPQAKLALSLGATGFLQKPVKRVDLLTALDYQMEQMRTGPG